MCTFILKCLQKKHLFVMLFWIFYFCLQTTWTVKSAWITTHFECLWQHDYFLSSICFLHLLRKWIQCVSTERFSFTIIIARWVLGFLICWSEVVLIDSRENVSFIAEKVHNLPVNAMKCIVVFSEFTLVD